MRGSNPRTRSPKPVTARSERVVCVVPGTLADPPGSVVIVFRPRMFGSSRRNDFVHRDSHGDRLRGGHREPLPSVTQGIHQWGARA
jgi:hypothetical protein